MIGVLVHVCRDQTALATGLENAEPLFEGRPALLQEAAVASNVSEVLTGSPVVGLAGGRVSSCDRPANLDVVELDRCRAAWGGDGSAAGCDPHPRHLQICRACRPPVGHSVLPGASRSSPAPARSRRSTPFDRCATPLSLRQRAAIAFASASTRSARSSPESRGRSADVRSAALS